MDGSINITGASEINPDGNLDFSFDQTFVFFAVGGNSITVGCMDEAASNYNAGAVVDDGSCEYPEVAGPDGWDVLILALTT